MKITVKVDYYSLFSKQFQDLNNFGLNKSSVYNNFSNILDERTACNKLYMLVAVESKWDFVPGINVTG